MRSEYFNFCTWRWTEFHAVLKTPLGRKDSRTVPVTHEQPASSFSLGFLSHVIHVHQEELITKHLQNKTHTCTECN